MSADVVGEQGGSGDKQFLASATAGEWHFAALTFNGTSDVASAFIDGRLGFVRAPGNVPTRTSPLFVCASSGGLLNAFNGHVHDVRVYNRELSLRELRQLWAEMSDNLQVGG